MLEIINPDTAFSCPVNIGHDWFQPLRRLLRDLMYLGHHDGHLWLWGGWNIAKPQGFAYWFDKMRLSHKFGDLYVFLVGDLKMLFWRHRHCFGWVLMRWFNSQKLLINRIWCGKWDFSRWPFKTLKTFVRHDMHEPLRQRAIQSLGELVKLDPTWEVFTCFLERDVFDQRWRWRFTREIISSTRIFGRWKMLCNYRHCHASVHSTFANVSLFD